MHTNREALAGWVLSALQDRLKLSRAEIMLRARGALDRSQRPPFSDPRLFALALGYRIRASVHEQGHASIADDLISFRWTRDQRECSLNVFIGIAMMLLTDTAAAESWADICLLAGHLVLPDSELATIDLDALAALQPFAPVWFLQARITGLHSSGIRRLA